jgi:hypothetical protein
MDGFAKYMKLIVEFLGFRLEYQLPKSIAGSPLKISPIGNLEFSSTV